MTQMKKGYWLLSLIACTALLLGLQPIGWTWAAWFAFIPLFLIHLDSDCKTWRLLVHAAAVGLFYYGYGFYWLIYFIPLVYVFALLITLPVLPLYFLCLRLLTSRIRSDLLKITAAAAIWTVLRKIYGLTPFGTIVMDAPFDVPLPFLRVVSVADFAVLPGLIIGLNFSIALFWRTKSRKILGFAFLLIAVLAGIYIRGACQTEQETSRTLSMALVQNNLQADGLWTIDHPHDIRRKYRELALEAAAHKPDLIVFPLYNFPDDILRQPRFFLDLARETNSGILVASQIPKTEGQTVLQSGFMNMAVLYSPDGEIAGQYQAVQPPPFAGSKPIREHTSPEYKVIDSPLGKLGILLCYEDSIPVVARKAVKAGAEILIALSNPGFFTTTHMPYYHLKQSQLRAIESGRQVIRVSANGYTAHIDSTGKVLQKSRLSTKEILYVEAGEIPSAETRRTTKTTRASTN